MKTTTLYPSRFLKPTDIPEGGLVCTIAGVEMEMLQANDGTSQNKPVIGFVEKDVKSLIANKTNIDEITKQLGDETDDWIGGKIKLMVIPVQAFNKIVDGIRVAPRRKTAPAVARPAAPVAPATVAAAKPRATTPVAAEVACPDPVDDAWDQAAEEGETIEL